MATKYDSRPETQEHINEVRGLLNVVAGDLTRRGEEHDASKLEEPEKAAFDEFTQGLRSTTFGSPEYEEARAAMGPALTHHYESNDHHPEHFPAGEDHEVDCHDETAYHPSGESYTVCRAFCSACEWSAKGDPDDTRDEAAAHERENYHPGGIHAMNLIQLLEMLCDWIAATRRHADGDIHRSIAQNAKRFGYGEDMERLLHTSADSILALEAEFVDVDDVGKSEKSAHPCCDDPPNPKFRKDDPVFVGDRRGIIMFGAARHESTEEYPNGYWQYAVSVDGRSVNAFPDNPYREDEIDSALCTGCHHTHDKRDYCGNREDKSDGAWDCQCDKLEPYK